MAAVWSLAVAALLSFVVCTALTWLLKYYSLRSKHPSREVRPNFRVLIVGAGYSGLCMGIKLKAAKVPFTILEKAAGVGGTWWHNRYPGCACDIPSHLYSFSFAP